MTNTSADYTSDLYFSMFSHIRTLIPSIITLASAISSASFKGTAESAASSTRLFQTLQNASASLEPTNATTADVTRYLNDWNIGCSSKFGRDVRIGSCDNALAKMGRDPAPLTFGPRERGSWDVTLPYKFLSGALNAGIFNFFFPSAAVNAIVYT